MHFYFPARTVWWVTWKVNKETMILAGGVYYKLYKTSEVLLLPSCWLWGRWGPLNTIPRSQLASMEKPVGLTCWFGVTQKQQTGKNQCSSKGKGIGLVQINIWKHKIWFFSEASTRNQQCTGADSGQQACCRIQTSFPVQLFAWTLCCKGPEFNRTESHRVKCKLGSVRVKKNGHVFLQSY